MMALAVDELVQMRLTSSRVNLNLREEKGYPYGAGAGARVYGDGGGIVGGADVRNAKHWIPACARSRFRQWRERRRLGC